MTRQEVLTLLKNKGHKEQSEIPDDSNCEIDGIGGVYFDDPDLLEEIEKDNQSYVLLEKSVVLWYNI